MFFKYLIAPSAILKFSSVIKDAGSSLKTDPIPLHVGQAPRGLLKENIVGSSFPNVKPQ